MDKGNSITSIKKQEKKATEKHKELSTFIKQIHSQLRSESTIYGPETAWNRHILQTDRLKNYAESMYQLATQHWGQQSYCKAPFRYCRIEWIKHWCKDYFINGGMKTFDDKEEYFCPRNVEKLSEIELLTKIETKIESTIKILDVGSCYNPFGAEDIFSVTAIDIAPYSKDVKKCDFINLKVENTIKFSEDELIQLPKNSFDVVIFSLFLEYIPCPTQRFLCCEKAYNLLKNGGILFIATPDSKHQGANTKIINTSWKVVLAKLGLMRIHYEKLPHIHCLMFRKCFYKEAALRKINWKKIPEDELFSTMKIYIPQDFHNTRLKEDNPQTILNECERDDQELINIFNELPYVNE